MPALTGDGKLCCFNLEEYGEKKEREYVVTEEIHR